MIELIVVIGVITLIAGIVAPMAISLQKGQVTRNFYTSVRDLSVKARNEAINRGLTMTITSDGNQKHLEMAVDTTVATSNTLAPPSPTVDVPAVDVPIPDDVTLQTYKTGTNDTTEGEWKLHFYPDGSSDGGGFEIAQGSKTQTWIVATDGSNRMLDGTYPDPTLEKWQAGDYAKRL
jgi:Tfp pilus assembly protein FimT